MNPDLKFTLSLAETNIVMKHLGQGMYTEVAGVVAKLQQQYAEQMAPPAAEPVAETPSEN